jgi:alanine racemase
MEVNASALRRNLTHLRGSVGEGVEVLPLVKADAYGVGILQAVAALERETPWGYGVATVEEGLAIRRVGVTRPVLVLSPAPRGSYRDAVEAELTLCVSSVEAVQEISAIADEVERDVSIHVEIDTGMGRSGLDWRLTAVWGDQIGALTVKRVHWDGVFTHFHSADRSHDPSVEEQVARFGVALDHLRGGGERGWVVHLSNSAASLRPLAIRGGLVRPGIFLYGGVAGEGLPAPEAVVAVRARVVLVRSVPPGTTVGYGAEHRAQGQERWATVGIGYGDGLPRSLGNRGSGLVRGSRVPIIGRISMDLTVVDISHLPNDLTVGEVVTFIGSDGDEVISLEAVAELAGTINYEILTGMSARLPRIWMEDGRDIATEIGDRNETGKG